MFDFQENAEKLAALYVERALLNKQVYDHELGIQKRHLALTPADGWPGKNEEARKATRDTAFAADEELGRHLDALTELRGKLIILNGDIEAAEAERRAAEWQVRARLTVVLDENGIQPNHRGDRVENAFEDAAQQKTDQAASATAAADKFPDGDEIPPGELPAAAVEEVEIEF